MQNITAIQAPRKLTPSRSNRSSRAFKHRSESSPASLAPLLIDSLGLLALAALWLVFYFLL